MTTLCPHFHLGRGESCLFNCCWDSESIHVQKAMALCQTWCQSCQDHRDQHSHQEEVCIELASCFATVQPATGDTLRAADIAPCKKSKWLRDLSHVVFVSELGEPLRQGASSKRRPQRTAFCQCGKNTERLESQATRNRLWDRNSKHEIELRKYPPVFRLVLPGVQKLAENHSLRYLAQKSSMLCWPTQQSLGCGSGTVSQQAPANGIRPAGTWQNGHAWLVTRGFRTAPQPARQDLPADCLSGPTSVQQRRTLSKWESVPWWRAGNLSVSMTVAFDRCRAIRGLDDRLETVFSNRNVAMPTLIRSPHATEQRPHAACLATSRRGRTESHDFSWSYTAPNAFPSNGEILLPCRHGGS